MSRMGQHLIDSDELNDAESIELLTDAETQAENEASRLQVFEPITEEIF